MTTEIQAVKSMQHAYSFRSPKYGRPRCIEARRAQWSLR